jgi:hypothetical protein
MMALDRYPTHEAFFMTHHRPRREAEKGKN